MPTWSEEDRLGRSSGASSPWPGKPRRVSGMPHCRCPEKSCREPTRVGDVVEVEVEVEGSLRPQQATGACDQRSPGHGDDIGGVDGRGIAVLPADLPAPQNWCQPNLQQSRVCTG